jgi:hypothetical protein
VCCKKTFQGRFASVNQPGDLRIVADHYIKLNDANLQVHSSIVMSCPVPIPGSKKTIKVPTGLFINNEFVSSIDSQELIQFVDIFLLLAMVR